VHDFGSLPSNRDAVPTFDPLTQVELAMEFLEGLSPTDVFDQVAAILIDEAFGHIQGIVRRDIAAAVEALEAIRGAVGAYGGQGYAELWRECEGHLAVIDLANAVLPKVGDPAVTSKLVREGKCIVGLNAKLFQMIDFERLAEQLVKSQWFRFACTVHGGRGRQKQEMFIAWDSAEKANVVIATVARESYRGVVDEISFQSPS
jgi:hypothetical protein